MEEKYDCTNDVLKHRKLVSKYLTFFINRLIQRSVVHDESKLHEPEKSVFNQWTPELRKHKLGSPEYENALKEMGTGLLHHYNKNRHHPEHFELGIDEMTLVDVIEMFCDWVAASKRNDIPVNLEYMQNRFQISPMLIRIFRNTIEEYNL